MSELAFTQTGDTFDPQSEGAVNWRPKRMKPRGAPELVYGKDGRPLVVPIDATMDELRVAVGQPGRYRLDPIDEHNRVIETLPAAYVQVVRPERNAAPVEFAPRDEPDAAVREAMRLNTDLARSVIEQLPAIMTASADLLRAADGAGLPARAPRLVDGEQDGDGDEHDGDAPAGRLNVASLLEQLAPLAPLVMAFFGGKGIDAAALVDWRKAVPSAPDATATNAKRPKKTTTPVTDPTSPALTASSMETTDVLPPIEPQTMAHFIAIQSALAPPEAALAREVAGELAPAELRAWFDELAKLSVPDAVTKIRTLIAGKGSTEGGAS
ncbi:MAG TPA: hypothetical protein VK427_21755 [Kofleriaceae bacterium]|nr:hypothetical protein [Kofleriaceae bacterium]